MKYATDINCFFLILYVAHNCLKLSTKAVATECFLLYEHLHLGHGLQNRKLHKNGSTSMDTMPISNLCGMFQLQETKLNKS